MTDWRAENVENIRGESLSLRNYAQPSESWDHDHCNGCWDKFMEAGTEGCLTQGYVTSSDIWICPTCFHDLKETMSWTVVQESS